MDSPTSPAAAGAATASAANSSAAASSHSSSAAHPHKTLTAEVRERTGINIAKCYQCGKCSAGCPMAVEMAMPPHEVVNMSRRNQRDKVLKSDGIWLCVTCSTCSARCPNGVDPARVFETLREIALDEDPGLAPRRIFVFNKTFLDQVRASGRIFEMGLGAQFNMRTGSLLQDAAAMPALLKRGKLSVTAPAIKNPSELRRLFANVEAAQRGKGKGDRS
jgi:heterodisulfide reductase subunit C2